MPSPIISFRSEWDLLNNESMSDFAIFTDQLTKTYGRARGIQNVDLRVDVGDVFGFLGPNGAGKTTTIRLLLDHIRPTSGRASILGLDCRRDSVAIHRLIGYLPSEFALWDDLTGAQTLEYFANLRSLADRSFMLDLAKRFDLDLSRRFREYSRGNKQKVGIIQAFMHRPKLLILDEPTSGLDPFNQQEFHRLVTEARAASATIFLSSHLFGEVERVCTRVGIVRAGELVRVAQLAELVTERARTLELTFNAAVAPSVFADLANIQNVQAHGNVIVLTLRGELGPTLQRASGYGLTNVVTQEPTLEEAFMAYYTPEP